VPVVTFASGFIVLLLVVPTLAVTMARVLPGNSLLWVILRACTPVAIITYTLAVMVLVFVRGPLEATHADVPLVAGTDHGALVTRIAWTDSR